jgi:hypothetical protein
MAGSAPVGAVGGEGIKKSKKKIARDKEKGLKFSIVAVRSVPRFK